MARWINVIKAVCFSVYCSIPINPYIRLNQVSDSFWNCTGSRFSEGAYGAINFGSMILERLRAAVLGTDQYKHNKPSSVNIWTRYLLAYFPLFHVSFFICLPRYWNIPLLPRSYVIPGISYVQYILICFRYTERKKQQQHIIIVHVCVRRFCQMLWLLVLVVGIYGKPQLPLLGLFPCNFSTQYLWNQYYKTLSAGYWWKHWWWVE